MFTVVDKPSRTNTEEYFSLDIFEEPVFKGES